MATIAGSSSTTIMVLLVAGKCEFVTGLISSKILVAKNVPSWFFPIVVYLLVNQPVLIRMGGEKSTLS